MSIIRRELNNPLRLAVKAIALAVVLFLFGRAAYANGVRHAIENACPYVDGQTVLIDFDGQVHEYDLV